MSNVAAMLIHRSNTTAENVSNYFERTITTQLLSHLMCELDCIAVKFIVLNWKSKLNYI